MGAKLCSLSKVLLYDEVLASEGRASVLRSYILYEHQAEFSFYWSSGRKLPPSTNHRYNIRFGSHEEVDYQC